MNTTNDLPPLANMLANNPAALILALNDRLRRITDALNAVPANPTITGSGVTKDAAGNITITAPSGVALKTNGVLNPVQTLLNLVSAGALTLFADGYGDVTIFAGPTAFTPATSGAAGTAGQFTYDTHYLYLCVAVNTWLRVAIATW